VKKRNNNLAPLREELPDGDFSGLEDLSAAQAELLAEAFHELREARREELEQAIEQSLRYVPLPLRGAARRILFS
jgi:hypothetical protein